jgi:cytochrome c5
MRIRSLSEVAQNGVRREAAPGRFGGARRTLCALAAPLVLVATAFAGDFTLPEGGAKKTIEAACVSCHTLEVLNGKQWTKLRWEAVVANMVERGASLKKSDSATVVDYLTKNFGEERGQELVEDICSLCHEWQRVKSYPKTREQWTGTIKGMIFEGAPVTDEEFNLIVDYLAKNYGPAKD